MRKRSEFPLYFDPMLPFKYDRSGRRSHAYRSGNFEVKVLKKNVSTDQAIQLAQTIKSRYEELRRDLNPYMVDSTVIIGSTTQRSNTVSIVQPRVEGISILSAIQQAKKQNISLEFIEDFLKKCLFHYQKTGFMPDVFGSPFPWLMYSPKRTPNVFIVNGEKGFIPVMVDIDYTDLSLKRPIGTVHDKILAKRVQKLFSTIQ